MIVVHFDILLKWLKIDSKSRNYLKLLENVKFNYSKDHIGELEILKI